MADRYTVVVVFIIYWPNLYTTLLTSPIRSLISSFDASCPSTLSTRRISPFVIAPFFRLSNILKAAFISSSLSLFFAPALLFLGLNSPPDGGQYVTWKSRGFKWFRTHPLKRLGSRSQSFFGLGKYKKFRSSPILKK